MIPLPDAENRERILRVILEKEEIGSDIDYKELADATEGYSGSDLKVRPFLAEVSVSFEKTVVVSIKNWPQSNSLEVAPTVTMKR